MTAYVTEVCPSCGNLRSVCSDPTVPWYPQRSVCYASAAREQVWRMTRDRYGHPEPTQKTAHKTDGLVWLTTQHDLTPQDDFFGEGSYVPGAGLPPSNGEADDEQH